MRERIWSALFVLMLALAVLPKDWLHDHGHCHDQAEQAPSLVNDCPVCDQLHNDLHETKVVAVRKPVLICFELFSQPIFTTHSKKAPLSLSRGPPAA